MSDEAEARFREHYAANLKPLLGYALRRTESPEAAADVVAETMLVAWRRIEEMPRGPEARLWLYGVARRVIANTRRSTRRRNRLVERLRAAVVTAMSEVDLGYSTFSIEVASALRSLSDAEREILLLAATEGLTPSEIASVLEMNPQTVRTHLHRARLKVRSFLANSGSFGELGDDTKQIEVAGHVEVRRDTPCLDESKGSKS